MSATATLTTPAHSLCLFSKHPPSPHQQQQQLKQASTCVDGTRSDKDKHCEPPEGRNDAAGTHMDLSCPETQPAPSTTASTTPALSPPASSLKERSLAADDNEDYPETTSSRQSDYATDSSWPRAVDALAQRLWDCGRDPLSHDFSSSSASSSSSNFPSATQMESAMTASFKLSTKGSFTRRGASDTSAADAASDKESDEDSVLCDGPYVHVNYAVAPSEMPAAPLPSGHTIMLQQKQQKKSTRNRQTWQQQQQQQQQQKIMQGHPLTSRIAFRIPPPFSATNNDPSSLCLTPMSAPESKSLHQNSRAICDRLQLIHYQPVTNPFKTMAKSATASPTTACSLKPIAPPPPSSSSSAETMDSPPATANSATDATARAEKKAGNYFSNRRQRELLPSLVSPMSLRRPAKRHHHYEQDD
ncbi:hypothetical protein LPJ59_004056, partial [Coemansia sp. RSA 2399]